MFSGWYLLLSLVFFLIRILIRHSMREAYVASEPVQRHESASGSATEQRLRNAPQHEPGECRVCRYRNERSASRCYQCGNLV